MMSKINILFVIPQLEQGGSETLVYNIATRLERSRFNAAIAYFQYYGNETFRNAFRNHDVRLYHVPVNRSVDLSAMRLMARIVRENDIHIVNAHHFISMVYSFHACKIANRRRLVYTEHSSWEVDRVTFKWKVLGAMLMRELDCVMGISDDVTNALRRKFLLRDKNTLTITNGVDLEKFDNKNWDVRGVRNEFGLSDDIKVVATVANFRKVKNHLFLLRGFKELAKEFDNVKLLLIGRGIEGDPENSESEIRNYLEENGLCEKVILAGHRDNVQELLSIADVFCLTSCMEGLPISMLEAMSAGLPVVGTNVSGIRDVIAHGQNGFLVELSDHIALKDALIKLLRDEELKYNYGQASRKMVEDSYSIKQCVGRYQDLFLRIMGVESRGTY